MSFFFGNKVKFNSNGNNIDIIESDNAIDTRLARYLISHDDVYIVDRCEDESCKVRLSKAAAECWDWDTVYIQKKYLYKVENLNIEGLFDII